MGHRPAPPVVADCTAIPRLGDGYRRHLVHSRHVPLRDPDHRGAAKSAGALRSAERGGGSATAAAEHDPANPEPDTLARNHPNFPFVYRRARCRRSGEHGRTHAPGHQDRSGTYSRPSRRIDGVQNFLLGAHSHAGAAGHWRTHIVVYRGESAQSSAAVGRHHGFSSEPTRRRAQRPGAAGAAVARI